MPRTVTREGRVCWIFLDLGAQPTHGDVDDARAHVAMVAPNVFQQVPSGRHSRCTGGEPCEKEGLGVGQGHDPLGLLDDASAQIDPVIAELQGASRSTHELVQPLGVDLFGEPDLHPSGPRAERLHPSRRQHRIHDHGIQHRRTIGQRVERDDARDVPEPPDLLDPLRRHVGGAVCDGDDQRQHDLQQEGLTATPGRAIANQGQMTMGTCATEDIGCPTESWAHPPLSLSLEG